MVVGRNKGDHISDRADEQGYVNQYGLSRKVIRFPLFERLSMVKHLLAHLRLCQTFLGAFTIGLYRCLTMYVVFFTPFLADSSIK